MKKTFLGIVVSCMALTSCYNGEKSVQQGAESDAVLECIATRTSVRAYKSQPVEDEKINQLLKAAMAAPSAVNKQPWAFIVVKDKQKLQALADSLPNAKMTASAPLAIVVCGDMDKTMDGKAAEFWIQDTSAATENLLLAAHALGLGAVWTGITPNENLAKAVQGILGLPETIVPLNVIPVGYPDGNPKPKDKWKDANVHYDKW